MQGTALAWPSPSGQAASSIPVAAAGRRRNGSTRTAGIADIAPRGVCNPGCAEDSAPQEGREMAPQHPAPHTVEMMVWRTRRVPPNHEGGNPSERSHPPMIRPQARKSQPEVETLASGNETFAGVNETRETFERGLRSLIAEIWLYTISVDQLRPASPPMDEGTSASRPSRRRPCSAGHRLLRRGFPGGAVAMKEGADAADPARRVA